VTARQPWEIPLWGTNTPLENRPWAEGHPRVREASMLYTTTDEPLWPWTLHALAPLDLERSWLPLPADHESAWLFRNGKVRHGLVDLENQAVVAWRQVHGSSAFQPRPGRRQPDPP